MAEPEHKVVTEVDVKKKPRLDLSEPSMYNVIYLNDETTTVDFVIESLIQIFQYDQPSASGITEVIHNDGSAIVATLPYEIAEQKGVEVTVMARDAGYPLTVKLEIAE
jgi:ATP-dependent Clp protease adaptor protein ClpS